MWNKAHFSCMLPILAACMAMSPINSSSSEVSNPSTVNVTTAADLKSTIAITISERPYGKATRTTKITDPKVIQKIVSNLDHQFTLQRRVRCLERYQIKFELNKGRTQEFGYGCLGSSYRMLRGNQAFWQTQDIVLPKSISQSFGLEP